MIRTYDLRGIDQRQFLIELELGDREARAELGGPVVRSTQWNGQICTTTWRLADSLSYYINRATETVKSGTIIAAAIVEGNEAKKELERINMSSRLAEKLKAVAEHSNKLATTIEQRADAFLSRKDALEKRTDASFAPHEALLNQAETGLDEIDKALAQLSNGGPPLSDSGS